MQSNRFPELLSRLFPSEVFDLKPTSHLATRRCQPLAKPQRRKERKNEAGL
jgi:hypothetical protein